MPLRLYNTMKRAKEPFEPLETGKVTMYACGVTVYDFSHIGHARAMVVFDVMQRYLGYRGYHVTYVRNYTDIDDKIINRAQAESVPFSAVSERFIKEFDTDMESLMVQRPTHTPRATEHIKDMIAMIEALVAKGHAYVRDGDVYFDVASFPEYGKLSGRDTDSLLSGARVDIDERKKNPLDFALWKQSKPGEPFWESPWGKGRPGWHIECSAMSRKYLGEPFDIHCGGMDLVFPHHENEIAQAECATGRPFARYWIHNGFVNINSEKMSKSLQNFLTIREVLKHYHPEAVRLFLLSHHYRSPVDYSDRNLQEATAGLDRLYALLKDLSSPEFFTEGDGADDAELHQAREELSGFSEKFTEAMDDDFNTAAAIGHVYSLTRIMNTLLDRQKKNRKYPIAKELSQQALSAFHTAGGVLGLFAEDPLQYFETKKERWLDRMGITRGEVEECIAQRLEAKKEKNFERADVLRTQLAEKGIVLKDTPQGTEWSFKETV